jgi:hypothetical protein
MMFDRDDVLGKLGKSLGIHAWGADNSCGYREFV